jgi:hypothetical protein
MIGNTFTANFHVHGTLSADAIFRYTLPVDATLMRVDTIGTANVDSSLKIGTAADDDGYVKAFTPGKNNTLVTIDRGDFDGDLNSNTAECPRIAAGTTLLLTFTHASASNPAITLHFME